MRWSLAEGPLVRRYFDMVEDLGTSGAMGLARMGRKTILFDSQEYRFAPSVAIHNAITDDGRAPLDFVNAVDGELDSYPEIETIFTNITSVKNVGTDTATQFEVSNGTMTWTGRKLRSFYV